MTALVPLGMHALHAWKEVSMKSSEHKNEDNVTCAMQDIGIYSSHG